MYEVKSLDDCPKRLIITFKDGKIVASRWFEDDLEKGKVSGRTKAEEDVLHIMLDAYGRTYNDIRKWTSHRDKTTIENAIYISDHAYDRMKERMGLSKKAAERLVLKVYEEGKRDYEFDGEQAHYIKRSTIAKYGDASEYIAYGDFIYVFGAERVLITVLNKAIDKRSEKRPPKPNVTNRYANSKDEYKFQYIKGKKYATKNIKRKFHK